MLDGDLWKSAHKAHRKLGRPGISVFGAEGLSAKLLLEVLGDRLPHDRVRLSTAGRIRASGFEVEATLADLHQTIWFGDSYTLATFDALREAFGPPIHRRDL
ncbi:hypothetical protein Ga0074812_113126 [Parafrankia irregularis]|uniref:Uncharacterized protein n=2 Tax=Parafrankia TaxID=2994362 RepID=A0A0S4QS27_9ACTN|nr:hypothetical protein [Parafrankia irregularis]CUU57628.1 hypothetical protein Ga0074812_113126 [Parafrankia irregularis]